MVHLTEMSNGQVAGMVVAEICAVPLFTLYDDNIDRANYYNQVFFTQLLNGLHRRAVPGQTAYELLWMSTPVDNQTYKAEVRTFFLLRRMGPAEEVQQELGADAESLQNDFEEKSFTLEFLSTPASLAAWQQKLGQTSTQRVYAVSKKERAMPMPTGGHLYYTDVLNPSECVNTTLITNAMTQCPGCVVSIQIIPTAFMPQETAAVEQTKAWLEMYAANLQYRQGMRVDANTGQMLDAYDYYTAALKEPLFYAHPVVYGPSAPAFELAGKLIAALEEQGKAGASALEALDITAAGLAPAQQLAVQPWATSDELVFRQRETAFWEAPGAPSGFIRFKYLMTTRELRGAFKIPVDDGHAIGLESNKIPANRERLEKDVISEGNFRVGVIQGAFWGREASHAGIALSEFTKHGLIVGMPGTGKTNFSLGLLLQFWKDFNIPFLAIEPTKSEYRSLIDTIPELQIFTPGKSNVSPYIINPFIPPTGVTVESYVPSLMSAFKAAFSMPGPLPDLFLASINECYIEYGWKSTSTSADPYAEPFGFYEFVKVFKRRIRNMKYQGEIKSNMESAGVVRLMSLIEQNGNIYDTVATIPLEDLLRNPTVIELNAINDKEQKSLIMAFLLILICVYTKNNVAGEGTLKNVMLIDEAHVLLSGRGGKGEDSADSQGSTVEALEDLIAEIRSYGTSIIIADQSPVKVGRGIIENTNVKVIFKLVEKANKDIISAATNMSGKEYDLMGRLGKGEALLHYGSLNTPLLLKTYYVKERAPGLKDVLLDEDIAGRCSYWNSRGALLVPHAECAYNSECNGSCDFTLRTNADFLASRLANAYLPRIPDNDMRQFNRFLGSLDGYIEKQLEETPGIPHSRRLANCTKIKFLRKALLVKSYEIPRADYKRLLAHKNFLGSPPAPPEEE